MPLAHESNRSVKTFVPLQYGYFFGKLKNGKTLEFESELTNIIRSNTYFGGENLKHSRITK